MAVAMATASWWTCGVRDGMRPPKLRPNRSIGRRVMAFPILSNTAAVRHFEFLKILIFDHVTVIDVVSCCCKLNFIKIGSHVWPPDAHNCWMFNVPLLGNGSCRGNRNMADMSITWWDAIMGPPKFRSKRVIAFPTFSNMAAARYLELEFCHFGPRTKSAMRFDYPVKFGVDPVFAVGDIAILWFCWFGWKMPNHAPFWGFLGPFEPLDIAGRHANPQKPHPWMRTRHLSHKRLKSVQGCDLGATARLRRKKYNQDRTTKKSQKRNISHIWGQAPRKAIAIKLGTGVDVHEIVIRGQSLIFKI